MAEEPKPIKTERIDNPDGTYIKKCKNCKADKQECKNYKSCIRTYDENNRIISGEYFKNKNFKSLLKSKTVAYDDNCEIRKVIIDGRYAKRDYKSYVKTIFKDKSVKTYNYYRDNNFSELIMNVTEDESPEKTAIISIVFEKEPDSIGCYSLIYVMDKTTKRFLCRKGYKDKEFHQLQVEEHCEYKNGSRTMSTCISYNDQLLNFAIIKYDDKERIIKREIFKDDKFSVLDYIENCSYSKNGNRIVKRIYEEPVKNVLSDLYIMNKKGFVIYSCQYYDKEFKELYRKVWFKYAKGFQIRLRIYTQKQDGYYSEIIKYDKDENQICKKQYKFKGIIAHILFWLAR